MAQTLKLFTSDGRALTSLVSSDDSILLPTAITVHKHGDAIAEHADSGDLEYESLNALCDAYGLDADHVAAALAEA